MPDADLFQIIDDLTSFGLMALIVLAFFKGWIIATSVQQRLDALRDIFDTKLVAQDDVHAVELKAANDKIIALLEQRVEYLLRSLREREVRIEQGIDMISRFTEAQDSLATLTKLISKRDET